MRQICTVILLLISLTTRGQFGVVGKVYVDGRELEVIGHGPPYFDFEEYDTILTTSAKQYLDDFGKSYRDSLFSKQYFLIELTPGLTEKERAIDKDLGIKRLTAIIHYLEYNYGIDKKECRLRYSGTITFDGCEGLLVKERKEGDKAREN